MPDVNLFIPCLVREFLPETGMATAVLLRHFGYTVKFNPKQVCCGQVFINWGQLQKAERLAHGFLRAFPGHEPVVGPSGSCVAAVREKYAVLDLNQTDHDLWQDLRPRIFDTMEFLNLNNHRVVGEFPARVAVHRSCHLLRGIGMDITGTDTWSGIRGLEIVFPDLPAECCGFGGIFSVKMGEVAAEIGRRVVQGLLDLDPDVIMVPDAGCIMQVRSVLHAMGRDIPVMHPVEVLVRAIKKGGPDE